MLKASITVPGSVGESVGKSYAGNILKGIRDPIGGTTQLLSRTGQKVGLQSEEDVDLIELRNKIAQTDYEQNWLDGEPTKTQTALEIGGSMLVPAPTGKLKVAKTIGQMALRGVKTGAVGAAMQPVQDPDANFFEKKLLQGGVGAVTGAVLDPAISKAVTPAVAKTVNLVTGKLDIPPNQKSLLELAAKYKVPLTYGDITNNPVVKRAELVAEQLPVGMQKFRKTQQDAIKNAAMQLRVSLLAKMKKGKYSSLKALKTAVASGDKYAAHLAEEIGKTNDDWSRVIQTSGSVKGLTKKVTAGVLYDKIDQLIPTVEIPTTQTKETLEDMLKTLKDAVIQNPFLKSRLGGIYKRVKARGKKAGGDSEEENLALGLDPDPEPLVRKIKKPASEQVLEKLKSEVERTATRSKNLDEAAIKAFTEMKSPFAVERLRKGAAMAYKELYIAQDALKAATAATSDAAEIGLGKVKIFEELPKPGFTFAELRKFRADLGYSVRESKAGSLEQRSYQKLHDAVDQDMDDFLSNIEGADAINVSPEIKTQTRKAWKKANYYYFKQVVPYKDRLVAESLKSEVPDEIYGRWIMRGKGDRAKKFYQRLNPKGRTAVRYGIVSNALEQAVDEGTGALSPKKFVAELDKIKEAKEVFFAGDREVSEELQGFMTLLRHTERAGAFQQSSGGQRILPWMITGGAVATISPTVAGTGIGLSFLVKKLFTTPRGQRLLLASSSLHEKSPKVAKMFASFLSTLPSGSSKIIGQEFGKE